jgi:catechol 2,3-dioxygenase-like lactoylglutathione lyase family enzyme
LTPQARGWLEKTTQEEAMSIDTEFNRDVANAVAAGQVDMKLEVVTIPVSDVDRAKAFYASLGWRQDATPPGSGVVQFTPPGSACSLHFGRNQTSATPGSAQNQFLIVSDIEVARNDLVRRGVEVSEIFHLGPGGRIPGPDPERRSYGSLAAFSDPDGNRWLLQEVTARWPGRVDSNQTAFSSVNDLAGAMRRASAAHGEHEKRHGGVNDPNWPNWYAAYMAAELSGAALPE